MIKCQQLCDKWGVSFFEVFQFYSEHGEQSRDVNITLDQGIEIVLDFQKKDRYVSDTYLRHLERFSFKNLRGYFGGDHLAKKISAKDFQRYLRSGSWSIVSKNHLIRTTKTFFNVLKELGHIELNPLQKLRSISLDRAPEYDILKVREVRSLINQCLVKKNYPLLTALGLVLYCGCRIGEVKKMNWQHILYYDRSI